MSANERPDRFADHGGGPSSAARIDEGPLENALRLLGVVRTELAVPWTDLEIAPNGASAGFLISGSVADGVDMRRRDLLTRYVGGVIARRTVRIQRRRAGIEARRSLIASVRAWDAMIGAHVTASRDRVRVR